MTQQQGSGSVEVVSPTNLSNVIQQLGGDVQVDMTELANVFVARYENNLQQKRDRLSSGIRAMKAKIKDLERELSKGVDQTKYEIEVPVVGIKFQVRSVSVTWLSPSHYSDRSDDMTVNVLVGCTDLEGTKNNCYMTKSFITKIPDDVVATYKQLSADIERDTAELTAVLDQIKNVGQKERQIRGEISTRKLKAAGIDVDVLNDPTFLQLIEVK